MSDLFEELPELLRNEGPDAALNRLVARLRESRQYPALFHALLLKKRHELLLPLFDSPLPDDALAEVAREVGLLFLGANDIEHAWPYLRVSGDTKAVAEAIDKVEAGEGLDRIIEIAFHERVNPYKGLELVLANYGTCRAISFYEQYPDDPSQERARQLLVRTLHSELLANLKAAIAAREGEAPGTTSVRELLAGRDWLFGDYDYYVDTSHLVSVLRFSLDLRDQRSLELALEMAEYGKHLSGNFQYKVPPPFDDLYEDHRIYLAALAGREVDAAIEHFRAKSDGANPDEEGTAAAQIFVTLLGRLGRHAEAVAAFVRYLKDLPPSELACPPLTQLCELAGDYETLRKHAQLSNDPVTFLAALLDK